MELQACKELVACELWFAMFSFIFILNEVIAVVDDTPTVVSPLEP